jgi:uncharacterized membrane protein
MTTGGKPRGRAYGAALSGLVIGAILIGIELTQGARVERAIGGVVIILLYSLGIFIFQNRSETVSVLAGRPVDERWVLINIRALAVAATAVALLVLVGFAVAEIQGRDNSQFALVGLVFAFSYMVGLVWYRWRS